MEIVTTNVLTERAYEKRPSTTDNWDCHNNAHRRERVQDRVWRVRRGRTGAMGDLAPRTLHTRKDCVPVEFRAHEDDKCDRYRDVDAGSHHHQPTRRAVSGILSGQGTHASARNDRHYSTMAMSSSSLGISTPGK